MTDMNCPLCGGQLTQLDDGNVECFLDYAEWDAEGEMIAGPIDYYSDND